MSPVETIQTELLVLGAGPAGYTAAFCAADRGKKVTLVDAGKRLGGVCLNAGCIPSKALLHATEPLRAAAASAARGVVLGQPRVDLARLRAWKESVLEKLGRGLRAQAQKRGIQLLEGRGSFEDSKTLRVETAGGRKQIRYEKAIIASGSRPAFPPVFEPGNPRIMTSTEALDLEEIPATLLVVGGGYIGLELGTVYAALGSQVVLVEALDSILAGVDADLVRPVAQGIQRAFREVRIKTKVQSMAGAGEQITVVLESSTGAKEERYDRALVAVGRVPNSEDLGLEKTGVARDAQGFIRVDERRQTSDPAICAVGDVAGGALLAHKAAREARVAVEAICGGPDASRGRIIPAVVYTDPEVAWCGLTETEARAQGIRIDVARFPWSASGRALTLDRPDGLTKLILEPGTERILGVGIAGHGAGELIGEGVLAIEMEARARDLAESVHPHPTLSETLQQAAEAFYGR